jgi:hypothetical protein
MDINNSSDKIASKCFIGGCTRNCGEYIHDVFTNIIEISKLFEEVYVIISYDFSIDNTLQQLEKQKERIKNLEIIINTEPLTNIRTKNISDARNRIIDFIHKKYTPEWKYFIMMDMDEMCSSPINIDILYKNLLRNDWDALSFNRKIYYDIWALSYDPFVISCWNWGYDEFEKNNSVLNFMHVDIMEKLSKMNPDELFSCNSAFNGFAIYRMEKIIDCKYEWLSIDFEKIPVELLINSIEAFKMLPKYKSNRDDCEHREFHRQMIEKHNARIRICPVPIFNYPSKYEDLLK